MAMNRIPCPECGAGLKSATGFKVGQSVCCPKCETYFNVEEPEDENEAGEDANTHKKEKPETVKAGSGKKTLKAESLDDDDDDEDLQPKKKKKKKKKRQDDEEEWSYKNSPLRFAVLGVLIIVMLVLGFLYYQKYQREHAEDTASSPTTSENEAKPAPAGPRPGGPGPMRQGPRLIGPPGAVPGGGVPPGGFPGGGPTPKFPAGNQTRPDVVGGLFGGPSTLTPAEKTQLTNKFKKQLVGTWKADLGEGKTAQLVFNDDGKVSLTVSSALKTETITGTWVAVGVANRSTLLVTYKWEKLQNAPKPVPLVFDDDELEHPIVGEAGVIGVFRKS